MVKKLFYTIIFFLCASVASAGTYYVSPTGSANWATCEDDSGNPCAVSTITASVAAGDTVKFLNGTYTSSAASYIGGPIGNLGDPTMASGESGSWIVLEAADGATPIIDVANNAVFNLKGLSYIEINGFTFKPSHSLFIDIQDDSGNNATTNIVIKNNIFYTESTWQWCVVCMNGQSSDITISGNTVYSYNIENQTFVDFISFAGTAGEVGGNILISDNTMTESLGHVMIEFQAYGGDVSGIIIRNNTIENQTHTGINVAGSNGALPYNALIENNIIKNSGTACSTDPGDGGDCSEMVSCGTCPGDQDQSREEKNGIQLSTDTSIVRYNEIYKNGRGIHHENAHSLTPNDNYIYNNTFYKNCIGFRIPAQYTIDVDELFLINNIFRDNTETTYSETNRLMHVDQNGASNYDHYISYNLDDEDSSTSYYLIPTGTYSGQTLDQLDTSPGGTRFANNSSTGSANFVSEGTYDFTLQSGSDAIDAGGPLTRTNGTGSTSKTLIVNDATPFHDGSWCPDAETLTQAGVTCQADYICVGDTSTCSQIDIDTPISSNTITLLTALNWSDDAVVYLQKDSDGTQILYGTAPDMGATESDAAVPANAIQGVAIN